MNRECSGFGYSSLQTLLLFSTGTVVTDSGQGSPAGDGGDEPETNIEHKTGTVVHRKSLQTDECQISTLVTPSRY